MNCLGQQLIEHLGIFHMQEMAVPGHDFAFFCEKSIKPDKFCQFLLAQGFPVDYIYLNTGSNLQKEKNAHFSEV
jgi:hypothetical protein